MKKLISYDAGPLHKEIMWRNRARYETDSVRARKSTPSCAAQIFANQKLKYNKLELMLAANIRPGDVVGVLTYRDDALPGCRRDVLNDLAYFRRKVKAQYDAWGIELRMLWCIEGSHGEPGHEDRPRYHNHFVVPRTHGLEAVLESSWKKGLVLQTSFEIDARRWAQKLHIKERYLHPNADGTYLGYEPLARYMCKESSEENSVRTWSYTRACFKPVFDMRDVPDDYKIRQPRNCIALKDAHESSTGYEEIKYLSLAELDG